MVPRIGGLRLQAVKSADLSRLYRDLLEGGGRDGRPLSGRSVEYVHAVLRKAFADAVRTDQLLSSNPAERAKRPRKDIVQPVVMWTAADLAAFLASTQGHRLHAFFWLAAATGARRGELVNLRWADVHLGDTDSGEAGSVRLRGSVSVINGVRVEGSTKGGRERVVSIDPATAAVLKAHRAAQDLERELAGGSWVDDHDKDIGGPHVFRQELGAPLFPDTPTALMGQLLRQHNDVVTADSEGGRRLLPVIRLYDLRHLHASLLLKAGVRVHVVAHRLGHADPSVTLRVYAHVLDDQASHAATVFAEVLRRE